MKSIKPNGLHTSDKIALLLTTKVGSVRMLYLCLSIMLTWILLNQVILKGHAFDPYPYLFLLTCINLFQLLLMPLIMVGQNIQGRHAENRAQKIYEAISKNSADIERILKILSAQEERLGSLYNSLGCDKKT